MTWLSGSAPMKPSAGWPLTKAITAGIDWMPIWPGNRRMLVDVHLDELHLALGGLAPTFSSTGVSCLHGPHQGAQKSTSTGWRFDSSITSFMKVWVVVSLINGRRRVRRRRLQHLQHRSCPLERSSGAGRPLKLARIKWVTGAECNRKRTPASGRRPETAPIRGSWPVASRNFTRSSRAIEVVMVLTSG